MGLMDKRLGDMTPRDAVGVWALTGIWDLFFLIFLFPVWIVWKLNRLDKSKPRPMSRAEAERVDREARRAYQHELDMKYLGLD